MQREDVSAVDKKNIAKADKVYLSVKKEISKREKIFTSRSFEWRHSGNGANYARRTEILDEALCALERATELLSDRN